MNQQTPIAIAHSLTGAQKQLLLLIAKGYESKDIANETKHKATTIASYRKKLYQIIGCGTPRQATLFAIKAELITIEDAFADWSLLGGL